jgi:large conductance mechanosensitive channel
MLQDFKKFLMKGNVMDLAVAVVIGVAFAAVVTGFVDFILMPIIGIVGGEPSFDEYFITINDSVIRWGSFVTVLVSFVILAAAVFVAVRAFEAMQSRGGDEDEDGPSAEDLLTEIRDLLKSQQQG